MAFSIFRAMNYIIAKPLAYWFHSSAVPCAVADLKIKAVLPVEKGRKWTIEETNRLEKVMRAQASKTKRNWTEIAESVGSHKRAQCAGRWYYCVKKGYVEDTPNKCVYVLWTEEMKCTMVDSIARQQENKKWFDWDDIIYEIHDLRLSHDSCRRKWKAMGYPVKRIESVGNLSNVNQVPSIIAGKNTKYEPEVN